MPQNVADAVSNVLRGVIEGGFAQARRCPWRPPARPAPPRSRRRCWFCGYTSHYAAAATIAGIDALGRPESLQGKTVDGSYISDATGSGFAAPIWGDALDRSPPARRTTTSSTPTGIEGVGVTAADPPKPPKGPKGDHGGGNGGGGNGNGGGGGGRPASPAGGVPPRRPRHRRPGP